MPGDINKGSCKSLIEHTGQTMLGHLLDSLVAGGITDFVITTNPHSDLAVRDVVAKKNLKTEVVKISSNGFRQIPFSVKDHLGNRFLFVCGHHPLSVNFVKEIIKESEKYECVITAYDNAQYPYDNIRMVLDTETPKLKIDLVSKQQTKKDCVYLRNPYIINKQVVYETDRHNYEKTFSLFLLDYWKSGGSLGVVRASMPPEFDYDSEFAKTQSFLDATISDDKPIV